MPFTRIGPNKYRSPSGRIFNDAQVKLYYANGGKFPGQKGKKVIKMKRKVVKVRRVKMVHPPMDGKEMKKMYKKKKKNWIAGAIKHPGALHRELGVKEGEKIPARRLASAAKKPGVEGRRARLAETLRGLHHKKGKK